MNLRNTIQVYGLPRSGTNFIEWSLVENFRYIRYENIYEQCAIKEVRRWLPKDDDTIAVKHQYPSFDHANKIIVIYKDWGVWIESFNRWAQTHGNNSFPRKIYDNYLKVAESLDPERTMILQHSHSVKNFSSVMHSISEKFGLITRPELKQPMLVLDKGGARCQEVHGKKFELTNKGLEIEKR